jgi:AraC-like DNA-binding protein
MGRQKSTSESGAVGNDTEATKAAVMQAERIERAKQFIADNYLHNPSLNAIAAAVDCSPFHFHRTFTKATGFTPKDYVDQFRIEEAKRRILSGEPLATVATDLKWSHQSHFTSRFRQIVGEPPARWIRHNAA